MDGILVEIAKENGRPTVIVRRGVDGPSIFAMTYNAAEDLGRTLIMTAARVKARISESDELERLRLEVEAGRKEYNELLQKLAVERGQRSEFLARIKNRVEEIELEVERLRGS